jgi:3D (Asp-Asp-Asp) domain-containing protein
MNEINEIPIGSIVHHERYGECVVKSSSGKIHGREDLMCVVYDSKNEPYCVAIKDLTLKEETE